MTPFFCGISIATFLFSALIFFRLWRVSCDRFFLFFSLGCALFAIERAFAMTTDSRTELAATVPHATIWVFVIRLLAFLAILAAIVKKNRGRERRPARLVEPLKRIS